MKIIKNLSENEKFIIADKGTERPFTGKYDKHFEKGIYTCKNCGLPLYKSEDKFDSGCGWPSFDDEIPGAVLKTPDKDNIRTEITCSYCGAHLGHVFEGENLTDKNIRHCVNSVSMDFTVNENEINYERAFFAAGCFWGTESLFKKAEGVVGTVVGYSGGKKSFPTYDMVCYGFTGHAETVQVVYDKRKTDYEKLVKYFFELHDFTEINRQGPDIGHQYRSVIFYTDTDQKETALKIIENLKEKNYDVATKVEKMTDFWKAEEYHQDYYIKTGGKPYCHYLRKIF